ncbi:hypothetical protein H6776_01195 [Candidatus Nomurabacteria bacterium]|nr:hypothetical protein [Candidatus Nomurabacteria bacterium]
MSQTLLILFYIALGVLAVIIGRGLLFPQYISANASKSIFDIATIAQGARDFMTWIPRIVRMTLVNLASGVSLLIKNIMHRLERYGDRHEQTEHDTL